MEKMTTYEEEDIRIKQSQFDWEKSKSIILPIIILLLTIFLGNCFQNKSFRRNEMFKAKLMLLTNKRDEAIKIRSNTEDEMGFLRRLQNNVEKDSDQNELCKKYRAENIPVSIEIIKQLDSQANIIQEYVDPDKFPNKEDYDKEYAKFPLNQKIMKYREELNDYLSCADDEKCKVCSIEANKVITSLSGLIAKNDEMINDLIVDSDNWFFEFWK